MAGKLFFEHLCDLPSDKQTGWSEELQGVSHNEDHWFITQKSRIWKIPVGIDLNGTIDGDDPDRGIITARIPSALSDDYDHFGDLDYHNGYIFVGLENSHRDFTARMACFNAANLEFIGSAILTEQGTHASWCAINPADGFLYSSAFDDVTALFAYRFLVNNNNFMLTFDHMAPLVSEAEEPYQLSGIQGGVFSVGDTQTYLYLSSNADDTRGVQVFNWPDGRHVQEIFIDTELDTFGEEIEGLTYWDLSLNTAPGIQGQLHVLELDNDLLTADDIKCFKHYKISYSEFVANRNPASLEVHRWNCTWINLMNAEHKVGYDNLEQAFADGYDACHYCIGGEHDRR
jgi:hypothetical protein